MIITAEKRASWTPDINGNLALPESERVTISYDKPLAYKRSEWKKVVATRRKDGSIETYVDTDRAKVIRDSNVRIINLAINEDGKAKQIATGEELLNTRSAVCSLLVDALTMEILREDYKAELKNSEPASEPSS